MLRAPGMSKDAERPRDAGMLSSLGIQGMPEHPRDTQERWVLCSWAGQPISHPTPDGHKSLFPHDPGGHVVGESLSSLHSGWWAPCLEQPLLPITLQHWQSE